MRQVFPSARPETRKSGAVLPLMRRWSIVEVVRGDRSGSVMGRTVRRSWELIRSLASRGRVRVRFSSIEISNRQLTVKYLHVWKDTSPLKTDYDAAEQDHSLRYRYSVPDRRNVRCKRVFALRGYWTRSEALDGRRQLLRRSLRPRRRLPIGIVTWAKQVVS